MDDRANLPTARAERWFLAALLALFAAASVQYTLKVLTPRNGETTRSAIVRWREQLLQLDAGENIYERFTYPNPPIMALMLRPIAELPPVAGALLWYYLKVGLALATFLLAFRLAEDAGVPFPAWAKGLTVLLSLRPVLGDLMHGNVNLLIVFLVLTGLALYRRGRDVSAGVVIALAVACKVTPALFLPYFIWKRSWRVVAGLILGSVLFLFVIPGLFLGWSENIELLRSWLERMVMPFVAGGQITSEHSNQSLPGLVQRMVTHSPSFSEFENDQYVALAFHNIVDIGAAAKWVVKAFMALFAIGVLWACRTPTDERRSSRLGAEFAIVLLGMLLFSERTWKHHAVTLILPFAVLCYQVAASELTKRMRIATVATLVASALLMAATSTGLLPDEWAKLAQVYGAYTWVFVFQAAVLMASLLPSAMRRGDDVHTLARAA
jgi:alpha-1,2-mannosyltransferase